MGLPEDDEWSDEWDDEAYDLHDLQASSPIRPSAHPSRMPAASTATAHARVCSATACTLLPVRLLCAQVPAEAAPPPPVHWPSPLDVPDEIAAKSRAELPEACACLLTLTLTPTPTPTPTLTLTPTLPLTSTPTMPLTRTRTPNPTPNPHP